MKHRIKIRFLITLSTGDAIEAELLTRKEPRPYGSGCAEATLRLKNPADTKKLSGWMKGQVVLALAR